MEYTTLNPSLRQIRLLHLHPGKLEDELACQFSIISLQDHSAEYQALSYVWGVSTEKRVIYVEGQQKPITDNLWRALRALRHPDDKRILWVDALCIDQSNEEERSEQVSLMKAVYTQASSVEIWLGDSIDNVELAVKFFEDSARSDPDAASASSYVPLGIHRDDFDEHTLEGSAKKSDDTIRAIQKIMEAPWWQRTWTVQEFILAKTSAFHCGSHTFDSAILMQSAWHLTRHDESCCAFNLPFIWRAIMGEILEPMNSLLALKVNRLSFVECVGKLRFRNASNQRDRIYGLLGLGINDFPNLVQPDYSLPVEKVYESFVISLLKSTKNLDVFSHLKTDRYGKLSLPSFVPDWTLELSDATDDTVLQRWPQRWSHLDVYNACLGTEVEFNAEPGVLMIRGKVVDIVRSVASGPFENPTTMVHDARILDELLVIANVPPRHADPGQKKREEFWVAMCAGILDKHKDLPTQFDQVQSSEPVSKSYERISCLRKDQYEEVDEFFRSFNIDRWKGLDADELEAYVLDVDHDAGDGPVWYAVRDAHSHRKGMVTQGGSMGLVPLNANVGDVVAVLTGGRVPIILRPQEGYYTVVGDAYVHGIMDGEAMRDVKELEWIELH